MSVPVGQSLEPPLHAMHSSRTSWTSSARQPPVTSEPFTISCSTRARPRVDAASSWVAWYVGHITPPAESAATHLPTPVHRWTSAANFGWLSPVSYTHLRAHETRHDLVC